MERYLYVFRGGEGMGKTPEEIQEHMGRWGAWMNKLGEKGILEGGEPLTSDGRLVKSGGTVVTDGPFAEGSEVVGGYVLIKANDYDEAVELSKECPIFEASDGTVEVRQVALVEVPQ